MPWVPVIQGALSYSVTERFSLPPDVSKQGRVSSPYAGVEIKNDVGKAICRHGHRSRLLLGEQDRR